MSDGLRADPQRRSEQVRELVADYPERGELEDMLYDLAAEVDALRASGADPQEGTGLEADPTVKLSESAPDGGLCANCCYRPGTQRWVGDGGAVALVHGMYAMWCEVCVLAEQVAYAEEVAGNLPALRERLAALRSAGLDSSTVESASSGAVLVGDRQGQTGSGDDSESRPGGGES